MRMTNFERIKAMTVEEMAALFEDIIDGLKSCHYCPAFKLCIETEETCDTAIKQWPESEAQSDDR